MALKTFNVQEDVYKRFSGYCKENGINMSRQVELFMESFLEEDPVAKEAYLEKLEKIRKGRFYKVSDLKERYKA
jgi:hypothetical protein